MCKHCEGTERVFDDYSYMVVYDFGQIEVNVDDGKGTSLDFDVNYCPMCGRYLRGES